MAKMLPHVKSQEEMDLAAPELKKTFKHKFPENAKTFFFSLRFAFLSFFSKFVFSNKIRKNELRSSSML